MRRCRYIIPAGAVIVLLGVMVARPSGSFTFWNPAPDSLPERPVQDTKGGTGDADSGAKPAVTKRSTRDMGRKPTKEETIALLQTTAVSQFDVEDSALEETVARLNQLARDRGIPERELTFSIDHRVSHLRIRELRVRNVPLLMVPKYVCGNSKVRWWVDPGKVTFGLYDDFGPETDITEKNKRNLTLIRSLNRVRKSGRKRCRWIRMIRFRNSRTRIRSPSPFVVPPSGGLGHPTCRQPSHNPLQKKMAYLWRNLPTEKRGEILEYRKRLQRPWHRPPHYQQGNIFYHLTAACFNHHPHIGLTPSRMADFSEALLATLQEPPTAWCVLPNHYHVLVRCADVKSVIGDLGKLHGKTSFLWNGEEGLRGRQVWHSAADRGIRNDGHFWATVNYIHHNPVKHGYVEKWTDWPFSSAADFLEEVGRERAADIWKSHPVLDYGKGWDD